MFMMNRNHEWSSQCLMSYREAQHYFTTTRKCKSLNSHLTLTLNSYPREKNKLA
ncbi:hypothetical protein V5799_029985, partial [Amblyomma americanum]